MATTLKGRPPAMGSPEERTRVEALKRSGIATDDLAATALVRSGGRTRELTHQTVPDDALRMAASAYHTARLKGCETFHRAYAFAQAKAAEKLATRGAGR